MSARSPPRPLSELRKSYQAHLATHHGSCEDAALMHELVEALEKEVQRLEVQLGRSGTVYHMPRPSKA